MEDNMNQVTKSLGTQAHLTSKAAGENNLLFLIDDFASHVILRLNPTANTRFTEKRATKYILCMKVQSSSF